MGKYEKELKQYILENRTLFGNLGEAVVSFEVPMAYSKNKDVKRSIADVIIYSEKKAIIGVEIKSERDSTQRLNRQIKSLTLNCNYAYVMIHDKHYIKTKAIMDKYPNYYKHIGIITYTKFKDKIIAGITKEAEYNHKFSSFHCLQNFSSADLSKILLFDIEDVYDENHKEVVKTICEPGKFFFSGSQETKKSININNITRKYSSKDIGKRVAILQINYVIGNEVKRRKKHKFRGW